MSNLFTRIESLKYLCARKGKFILEINSDTTEKLIDTARMPGFLKSVKTGFERSAESGATRT